MVGGKASNLLVMSEVITDCQLFQHILVFIVLFFPLKPFFDLIYQIYLQSNMAAKEQFQPWAA